MDDSKVFMFPEGGNTSSIDPNLLLALNNNGGFGGNGNWIWILFLWMMWGNNGWGNNGFNNNGGTGFLSNQLNNNAGRDLLLQAINGRADALNQLATMLNASVESVKNGIFSLQSSIQTVGSQVGMSGLETINAIQAGNATLGRQLCECCCSMRYDLSQQTNTLQAQAASNFAATQLEMAKNEAADQLAVCNQTNTLSTQNERNTNNILSAIQNQNAMLEQRFCEIKEREMESKINTQSDIITQLRNQISNDNQTIAFNKVIDALDDKVDAIAAKIPNTVPVQYPNLVAVSATPNYNNGFNPWGYSYGINGGSYWG